MSKPSPLLAEAMGEAMGGKGQYQSNGRGEIVEPSPNMCISEWNGRFQPTSIKRISNGRDPKNLFLERFVACQD